MVVAVGHVGRLRGGGTAVRRAAVARHAARRSRDRRDAARRRARSVGRQIPGGRRGRHGRPISIRMAAPSVSGLAAEVDRVRQARSADALVVGVLGGGAAQALPAGSQSAATSPVPPLQGAAATSTAELEARALNGAAGASLRELVAAAHAQRLERVVGWPIARDRRRRHRLRERCLAGRAGAGCLLGVRRARRRRMWRRRL